MHGNTNSSFGGTPNVVSVPRNTRGDIGINSVLIKKSGKPSAELKKDNVPSDGEKCASVLHMRT
jgi:hypothetical protein